MASSVMVNLLKVYEYNVLLSSMIEMLMPAQMHPQPSGAAPQNNLPMPLPLNKEQHSPPEGAAPERDKQLMPPPLPPPVSSTGWYSLGSPIEGISCTIYHARNNPSF